MVPRPDDPRYHAATVYAVADVAADTLKSWVLRGWLRLDADRTRKRWVSYSALDCARVLALAELRRAGVDLAEAAPVIDTLAFLMVCGGSSGPAVSQTGAVTISVDVAALRRRLRAGLLEHGEPI